MSCPHLLKNEIKHCLAHLCKAAWRQWKAKPLRHWQIVIILIGAGTYVGHKLGESQIWMDVRYAAYQKVLYRLTPRAPHPKRTVLVLIKDEEYWGPELQGRSPIDRDYLAKLLRKLAEANPAVIALDIDLSLTTDQSHRDAGAYKEETDRLLAAVRDVSAERTVVLARRLQYADETEKEYRATAAVFEGYDFNKGKVRSGYITLPPDIRRIPLALTMQDQTTRVDSFASAILGAIDEQSLKDAQNNEQDAIPYGTFIEPDRFIQRSASFVLSSDPKTLQHEMAFNVVIVGGARHQFGMNQGPPSDSHPSPVGNVYGAFVHANYVEALLDSRTYKPMRESWATGIEVVFSILLALFLSLEMRLVAKLGITIFLSAAVLGISYVSWQNLGLFFDFLVPVVLLCGHVLVEKLMGPSE